jgi:hypothetical protein
VIETHTHGPLFNGRAAAATVAMSHSIEGAVAQDGVNKIHQRLGEVLQNPSGFYESRVVTERRGDNNVITDNVVYSGWLEGTSSRNQSTRFKGYHTFRMVQQELEHTAGETASKAAHPYMLAMNL